MPSNQVKIANLALALFGDTPLQTLDDATPAGSAVNLLYDFVVSGVFDAYPWAFARDTRALAPLNMTTLSDGNLPSGWTRAYQLPADLIGPPLRVLANARNPDQPTAQFEIQNTTLYSNDMAVWIVGAFRVDEANWPDYFTTAIVRCLAADLYPVISGNGTRLKDLQEAAWGTPQEQRRGGALGVAMRRDAARNPSRKLPANPLVDVRYSSQDVRTSGAIYP